MAPAIVPRTAGSVFLVTAGNRGLGLEHVKQFLQTTEVKVVATARQPGKADELKELKQKYADRLTVVQLDTSDEASIEVRFLTLNGAREF